MLSTDPETHINVRALAGAGAHFSCHVSQEVKQPQRGEGRLHLLLSFLLVASSPLLSPHEWRRSPPHPSSCIQGSCSKFQGWKDFSRHWIGTLKIDKAGELVVESPKSKCWVGTADLAKVQGSQRYGLGNSPCSGSCKGRFWKGHKRVLVPALRLCLSGSTKQWSIQEKKNPNIFMTRVWRIAWNFFIFLLKNLTSAYLYESAKPTGNSV